MRHFTNRVRAVAAAAQVDEKPKEDFSDVGGLDKQIQASTASEPLTRFNYYRARRVQPAAHLEALCPCWQHLAVHASTRPCDVQLLLVISNNCHSTA